MTRLVDSFASKAWWANEETELEAGPWVGELRVVNGYLAMVIAMPTRGILHTLNLADFDTDHGGFKHKPSTLMVRTGRHCSIPPQPARRHSPYVYVGDLGHAPMIERPGSRGPLLSPFRANGGSVIPARPGLDEIPASAGAHAGLTIKARSVSLQCSSESALVVRPPTQPNLDLCHRLKRVPVGWAEPAISSRCGKYRTLRWRWHV